MTSVYPNLSNRLTICDVTYASLALSLNISENAVSLKMSGELPWKLPEVVRICELLRTSDANFLFLQLDSKS